MKYLNHFFTLSISYLMFSCSSTINVNTNEPINVFLETQKINKNKKIILQKDKISNSEALRIFNGGEGIEHVLDPIDKIDYTGGLFEKKHWKKMYKTYINDTIPKYWKKEDFPQYNFILENKKGLFNEAFYNRYLDSGINNIIQISQPMYYMNKKYIIFFYNLGYFDSSVQLQVVVMTKEKDNWVVVRVIGDYVYY